MLREDKRAREAGGVEDASLQLGNNLRTSGLPPWLGGSIVARRVVDERVALTVILNAAVTVFALESVAAHVTRVLPVGTDFRDHGSHRVGTTPSVSSWAVTLKVTRALFAPFFALTVLLVAPEIVGCVVLNSYPATFSVSVQVSFPSRPSTPERARESAAAVAPRYVPAPPVTVKV